MIEDSKMTGRRWADEIARVRPLIDEQLEKESGREKASEFWTIAGQLEATALTYFADMEVSLYIIAAKTGNIGPAEIASLNEAIPLILEKIQAGR